MWIRFGQELYNSDQFTRIICADWSNGQYVIELHIDRYYQSRIVLKFDTAEKRDIAFVHIVNGLQDDWSSVVSLNKEIKGENG